MGLHKKIPTPELLFEHFMNYKNWAKSHPIKIHDFKGSLANEVYIEKERPLTIEGFENWCFEQGIIGDLSHYFANTDNRYSDFLTICAHIRKIVRQDQIEGGMAGIYNPSITQRLNNLTERTDITTDGKDLNTSIKVEIVKPNEGNDCI